MPVPSLSDVTQAIIDIISDAVSASALMPSPPPVVLPDSPANTNRTSIGFYLYHICETPFYKNALPQGKDQPAIRFTPMGLILYYQLTPNMADDDDDKAIVEQNMMSVAMKALHDSPFVDTLGNDNKFRIVLQPIPATDAVHNWTAGSSPLKLSAYYEVSPVFLEPDKRRSYAARVFSYGNYIFTELDVRITGSYSVLTFTPPNMGPQTVTAQPGQAPPGHDIFFIGNGFKAGTPGLRLFNPKLHHPALTDGTWTLDLTPQNELKVNIGTTARDEKLGVLVNIHPGMYSAQLVLTKSLTLPNGMVRQVHKSSNQFPFVISPIVTPFTATFGSPFNITGYFFDHNHPDEVEIYVGEEALLLNGDVVTNPLTPGQFNIKSNNSIDVFLPGSLASGSDVPFRVLVSGAESTPLWIHVP
jgi:hypothetical protein